MAVKTHSSFSAETTGPNKVKFHMELLWDGGTKFCSKSPGHMTKLAAMPIYGKNLKTLFRIQKADDLVRSIGYSSTITFVQIMTLG